MRSPRDDGKYYNQDLILDPRAFLKGTVGLWQGYGGNHSPLMYGVVTIPKRLIDFAYQYGEPYYYKGERSVRVAAPVWEFTNENVAEKPPLYNGIVQLYTPDLPAQLRRDYESAIKKIKRSY